MVTKLQLFNGALLELGLRSLADTGEAIESGRALVEIYDRTVNECLEAGQWNFATRTVKLTADTGVETTFSYSKLFAKPTGWLRTIGISADEYLRVPLSDYQYKDENEMLMTDGLDPIYLRFISSDTGYGGELSKWPASFTRYVTLELADRICERLTQNQSKKEELQIQIRRAKRNAANKDAMNQGSPVMPMGRLTSVRSGGWSSRERGSRSRFTG